MWNLKGELTMDDLWGNIEQLSNIAEESNAVEILREQARLLEKKTNGKIKATFSKITYTDTTIEAIVKPLSRKEEVIESELKSKRDANEMYEFIKYKFEIYNNIYKFRVFTLNYRKIFPIQIEIEEGIKNELHLNGMKYLDNDEELKDIVSSVFSSRKLQTIIKRMLM